MLRILLYYLLLGAIGALDYVTGYETSLGCFYILFISLVAWNSGRMHGIVFSVLSAATWAFCDHVLGHHYLHAWTLYWNCANRVFTFTVLTLCLTKIRSVLEGQKRLIFDLRRLSLNLSQIYDLFPVCGLCHEFCVDDEVRQQIAQRVMVAIAAQHEPVDAAADQISRLFHFRVEIVAMRGEQQHVANAGEIFLQRFDAAREHRVVDRRHDCA